MKGSGEGGPAELDLAAILPPQLEGRGTHVCFPAPPPPWAELPQAIRTHDGLSVANSSRLARPPEERLHGKLMSNLCIRYCAREKK